MSTDTKAAEAISFSQTSDPNVPYWVQSDAWLEVAGLSRKRYDEEMNILLDCFSGHFHPVFEMLNELPETPELKTLKSSLNPIIRAPFTRPQNPIAAMQDVSRALVDVVEYYHNSRGRKAKLIKPLEAPDIETLKEIAPQNVNQKRAMVLLVLLKAKPKEALHTEDCKRILEGSEGAALDSKVIRRAMHVLAEIYNPKIVYEKIDGSYRVRANF